VAESFRVFSERLEQADDLQGALEKLIHETMAEHGRIIFSGNGYSADWVEEAAARGLSNYASAAEAIPHLLDEKNVALFERHKVFSRAEMAAVEEILLENYCKQINIDASVTSEMVRRDILPAVIGYGRSIAEAIDVKERIGGYHKFPHRAENELLDRVSSLCDELSRRRAALDAAIENAEAVPALRERALSYRGIVTQQMARIRETSDALEDIVSKSAWPYPSYGNLLYRV
jgi:glutamine synthetase